MDPRKRITMVLLFFFIFGIGIFTLAKRIVRIHDIRLEGWEVKEKSPKIDVKSFWAGEFQTRLDKWVSRNLGLRGAFVRLDNQINFSFFNEISSKYESRIILGKDRWLYEKGYIDSLNHRDEAPQESLKDKVQSLKKLQRLLESNGIHFLFLITPSKATIYPEYIKDKYIIPKHSAKESNYERIVPLLQEYGVRYLDGHQYLLALKQRGPYPVYPPSGTHWSDYSACYFTLKLISALENLTKQEMGKFRFDRIQITKEPSSSDKDLATLANILFEKSLYGREYVYPETSSSVSAKNVSRPRMLFVGGSYLWQLFYYLEKHQVYSEREFYAYYDRKAKYPGKTIHPIDKKNLDLKREILRQDIVVIEANEAGLTQPGFGFIEDALKALGDETVVDDRSPVQIRIRRLLVDLDRDGKTDIAIYRSSTGSWYVIPFSGASPYAARRGISADIPVPGDYDGDGKTNYAIFRGGMWFIYPSGGGSPNALGWGIATDKPVPADYDGDRKTDLAVFRGSTGLWYVIPSGGGAPYAAAWGTAADKPVPGDYDGDGKTDLAIFRGSTGTWHVFPSGGGAPYAAAWGTAADKPVPGDYDGDGKTDLAIFRGSTGTWHVFPSGGGAPYAAAWGTAADKPVPGDYDGDGKTDLAVFRGSTGTWYVSPSGGGAPYAVGWGTAADKPVPGDYDGDGKTDVAVYWNGVWYVSPSGVGAPYALGWGWDISDVPLITAPD